MQVKTCQQSKSFAPRAGLPRSERALAGLLGVSDRHLGIQRPEIVEHSNEEQSAAAQVDDSGDPFALVHPVHAEYTEEGQQYPGDVVVDRPGVEAQISLAIHRWDQKQVDDPADKEQAQGEKPDRSGHRLAIVEAVRTKRSEERRVGKEGSKGRRTRAQ